MRTGSIWSATVRAPFATLGVRTDGRAVIELAYLPGGQRAVAPRERVAERAVRELRRYLVDPSFRFTVPLAPGGTLFQRRVWGAIADIPAGQSRTYGELARKLVTAPRAIGQACGANRIALIIPCHRVVGGLGSLGGFMGEADGDASTSDLFAWEGDGGEGRVFPATIKRWLLAHEGYRFGR